MSTISTRIIEARKAKGMTATAVAKALSITPSGMSNWECGKFKPRPENLIELAKVLDVDPHYLEFGDETGPAEVAPEATVTVASILAAAKAEIATVTKMPPASIKLDLSFTV